MVFPTFFNLSLNFVIRSSWSEPQWAPGLVFADCIELLHLWLQKYNQSDFGIDHLHFIVKAIISKLCFKPAKNILYIYISRLSSYTLNCCNYTVFCFVFMSWVGNFKKSKQTTKTLQLKDRKKERREGGKGERRQEGRKERKRRRKLSWTGNKNEEKEKLHLKTTLWRSFIITRFIGK